MIDKLIAALNDWWVEKQEYLERQQETEEYTEYYWNLVDDRYYKSELELKKELESYLENKIKEQIILDRGKAEEDQYGWIISPIGTRDQEHLIKMGWTWNGSINRWSKG
jgi:hypothetical protein